MARADPVTAYARQVLAGKIVCGALVRQAAQRHVDDLKTATARGLRFDAAASEKAVRFFGLLRHSKGQWAGTAFSLAPWQAFVVGNLFGWKRADGTRRFRVAYIEVPRKNGKSTLLAGILLLLAFFDDENGAEVYCAATKRDQAKIVWEEAKRMVLKTPGLLRRIQVLAGSLTQEKTASKLAPLSADYDSMDGLNVHGSGIDELHAHKTSGIVDVLETATGARQQPLQVEITTAGYDRTSICWKHHDYTVKVLQGVVDDPAWFGYVAAADPGDDWRSPSTWAKANPNLGVSVLPDYLPGKARKAENLPAAQNAFRRLHLNEWTEQAERWLDMAVWDACGEAPVDPAEMLGRDCFAGLDMASTRDIAAWCLLFPSEDGSFDAIWRFWIPEDSLDPQKSGRSERDRQMLQQWVGDGLITATDGNVTDYDVVERAIFEDAERYRIIDLAFDRWNTTQLVTHLQNEFGTEEDAQPRVVGFGQGFESMAAPTKELERLLLEGKIRHGSNPVARWMASNVAVRQDPAGNMKPDRAKSAEKIDGIVALVEALGVAIRKPGAEASMYEDREPLHASDLKDEDEARP